MLNPPPHTQEVIFINQTRLLLRNVVKIEHGNWFHLLLADGKEYILNPANILFTKVYPNEKTDYE